MSISIANLREQYLESPLGELHIYLGKLLAVYLILALGGAASFLLLGVVDMPSGYTAMEYISLWWVSALKLGAVFGSIPALLLGVLWSRGVIARA